MNTYLQGRKITAAQDYERPSVETLHLICKLRWIGMGEEAERVEIVPNVRQPVLWPVQLIN